MYEPVLLLSGCSQKHLQYAAAKAQGWSVRISPTVSVPSPCSPQHLVQLFKWLGHYYKIRTYHCQWLLQDSLFLGGEGWTTTNNRIHNYIVIYCWNYNYKVAPALQLWSHMTHILICLIRFTLNLTVAMVVSFSFLSNYRMKIALGTCIFFPTKLPIKKVRIRCHECFYKNSAFDYDWWCDTYIHTYFLRNKISKHLEDGI